MTTTQGTTSQTTPPDHAAQPAPPPTSAPQTPAPQVWPTLRANDARALIRFLVEAFGFEPTAVYGEQDRVDHAQLDWPEGGGVMLGSTGRGPDDPWPLQPGTFGGYVVTADPDAVHERAVRAGADVVRGPNQTDHGSREFTVRDPEGNLWQFGTYPGQPRRPASAGQPSA